MAHSSESDRNFDANDEFELPIEDLDEKLETGLAELISNESLKKVSESTLNRWIGVAAPILKLGGKPVAVILSLGFISLPLMVTGSPWVALTLAIGASATAICSCFK